MIMNIMMIPCQPLHLSTLMILHTDRSFFLLATLPVILPRECSPPQPPPDLSPESPLPPPLTDSSHLAVLSLTGSRRVSTSISRVKNNSTKNILQSLVRENQIIYNSRSLRVSMCKPINSKKVFCLNQSSSF